MGDGARVVVIGSGLAGLSCASDLASAGRPVTVITPGQVGRDGASSRVVHLAPWILLTAPWSRGDSPRRFLTDLEARGEGTARPELGRVLAEGAHDTAVELCQLLDLRRLGESAEMLPGDTVARGLRCLPRGAGGLLGRLVAGCREAGVVLRERSQAVSLVLDDDAVRGVEVLDRGTGRVACVPGEAVVLACGGTAGLFPVSTVPRWCAGSGVALASACDVALHRPGALQWLPVIRQPNGAFLGSALLLSCRVRSGRRELGPWGRLEDMASELRELDAAGQTVTLELPPAPPTCWPARSPLGSAVPWGTFVALVLAAHHGIGGVAVDAWGRTSLRGLYCCGEAAGGVQGRCRTMGTGLIEARLFGRRVARAVVHDEPRLAVPAGAVVTRGPRPASRVAALTRNLDCVVRAMACGTLEKRALEAVQHWPAAVRQPPSVAAWHAGLRRQAVLALGRAAVESGRNEP